MGYLRQRDELPYLLSSASCLDGLARICIASITAALRDKEQSLLATVGTVRSRWSLPDLLSPRPATCLRISSQGCSRLQHLKAWAGGIDLARHPA